MPLQASSFLQAASCAWSIAPGSRAATHTLTYLNSRHGRAAAHHLSQVSRRQLAQVRNQKPHVLRPQPSPQGWASHMWRPPATVQFGFLESAETNLNREHPVLQGSRLIMHRRMGYVRLLAKVAIPAAHL